MKIIFFSVTVFILVSLNISTATQVYIPPHDTVLVPSLTVICSDTIYIDSSACLILGNSSCVCSGTIILGPGSVVIRIKNISVKIPSEYSLSQNYPNPFNPATKIKFQIKDSRFVILKIYDLLGREVAILVNEMLKPGTYEVDWNASECPSGVYFYRVEAGEYTDVKKMSLLK